MREEYDFSRARKVGPVIPPQLGKTRITIRLDDDIIEWFRKQMDAAGGGSYQAMTNDALRRHIEIYEGVLESTLRRVIREEFQELRKGKDHGFPL